MPSPELSWSRAADLAATYQDYSWFLAGLATLVFLVAWWRLRERAPLSDLALGAGAGLVTTVICWTVFLAPIVDQEAAPLNATSEFILTLLFAVQTAGWWVVLLRARGRVRWPLVPAGVGLIALPFWHDRQPELVAWLLLAVMSATVWRLCQLRGSLRWRRPALGLQLAAAWFSPAGPLAERLHLPQRGVELNPLGAACGFLLFLAAGAALAATLELAAGPASPERRQEIFREARRFRRAILLWLLAGMLAAWLSGLNGRRLFERYALGRVAALAANFDATSLVAGLGPDFRLGPFAGFPQVRGNATPYTRVKSLEAAGPAMRQLQRFVVTNPDVAQVDITTLHHDQLLLVVVPQLKPGWEGTVSLVRPATAQDLAHWAQRTPWFEGPTTISYGEFAVARAPVLGPDGSMLGWLQFSYHVGQWAGAQAQARFLTFGTVAAGAVIALLLFLRRLREQERETALRLAAEARAANQLKTTFLANVSHELRTPVQGIVGYTELLLAGQPAEADRVRLLALRRNGDLLVRLVNDLIDLGALETGAFCFVEKPTSLVPLVGDTIESLRPRAEARRLRLEFTADPQLPPWVQADPERLRQIVLNLVGNALKYTDAGRIDVHLRATGIAEASHDLELIVRDTGPGIAPADQGRLFEPFTRLDNTAAREGSGLGLALSARLARRMGGDITVESDGHNGSTFRARWRLKGAVAPVPAWCGAAELRGLRLLVADDNQLVRDLFSQGLAGYGAICTTAIDGPDALRQALAGEFDALIIDLAMPGLDGCEVTRRLRAAGKKLRIVGVSAHAGGSEREQARVAGMDAFHTKPIELGALAAALMLPPAAGPAPGPRPAQRAMWESMFRTELPAQFQAMDRARLQAAWPELQRLAHHVRNSAMVVGDEALFAACGALQDAAASANEPAAHAAWQSCRAACARWLDAAAP